MIFKLLYNGQRFSVKLLTNPYYKNSINSSKHAKITITIEIKISLIKT